MPETDLVLIFARRLNEVGVPYTITGSVAGVLYGEPRVTHDIDIVVAFRPVSDVERFARAFPLQDF